MVRIQDVRVGNLLIHKEFGVALVVKIEKDLQHSALSIIYGMDQDDHVYSGPCEDWFYFWSRPPLYK